MENSSSLHHTPETLNATLGEQICFLLRDSVCAMQAVVPRTLPRCSIPDAQFQTFETGERERERKGVREGGGGGGGGAGGGAGQGEE